MSDAELIAWLRDLAAVLGKEAFTCAADRIEALIAERNDWESHAIYNAEFVDLAVSYRNERDAARAQLAKAAEAIEARIHWSAGGLYCNCWKCDPLVTTLAEIKGQNHD